MQKINTIIFDCFGVICTQVLGGWFKKNMVEKGYEDPHLKDIFEKFDLGLLSENDIVEYFLTYKGVVKTKEELRVEIDSFLSLNVTLAVFIKKLKAKGYKTILLSNANNSFFERKIYPTYPEFKDLFDDIVISSVVGMVKPYKDIYLYTLGRAGIVPEEAVFIDDSKVNVDSAISLGIKGFVYTDVDSLSKYLESLGVSV